MSSSSLTLKPVSIGSGSVAMIESTEYLNLGSLGFSMNLRNTSFEPGATCISWPYRNCFRISVTEYSDVLAEGLAAGGDCVAAAADEDLPAAPVPGSIDAIEPTMVASRTIAKARFPRAISAPNPPVVRADAPETAFQPLRKLKH